MAEVTLEILHTELMHMRREMHSKFSEMQGRFDEMKGKFSEMLGRLITLEAQVVGLPMIGESIAALQRNVRMLTAAINDMARVNITAGEVEALHTELEHLTAKQNEIEAQLLQTRERLDRLEQRGTTH
jgi:SMC interacting uncharacterized protein involved in chromosome segregation